MLFHEPIYQLVRQQLLAHKLRKNPPSVPTSSGWYTSRRRKTVPTSVPTSTRICGRGVRACRRSGRRYCATHRPSSRWTRRSSSTQTSPASRTGTATTQQRSSRRGLPAHASPHSRDACHGGKNGWCPIAAKGSGMSARGHGQGSGGSCLNDQRVRPRPCAAIVCQPIASGCDVLVPASFSSSTNSSRRRTSFGSRPTRTSWRVTWDWRTRASKVRNRCL